MPDSDEVAQLQEQLFELVRKSQQAMVDAGRSFTERVASLTPGEVDQLAGLIDNAFDMTEKVLESQRDLAKRIVETVTSQLPGIDRGDPED